MVQYKDICPKIKTHKNLSLNPLQAFHMLGNSTGLDLVFPSAQVSQSVIQRIKYTMNDSGDWEDDDGEIHSEIDNERDELRPGAVYDTDTGRVTLPDGNGFFLSVSDEEESDSEDPEYVKPERDYILSPRILRDRRYHYLSGKMRSTALPSKKDWAKNYNAHHIIPNEVVRDNIKPRDVSPYNEAWNCIMLPNLSKVRTGALFKYKGKSGNKDNEKPLHANHPNYNYRVSQYVIQEIKNSDSDAEKQRKAEDLADRIRILIHQNTGLPQVKLDDIEF